MQTKENCLKRMYERVKGKGVYAIFEKQKEERKMSILERLLEKLGYKKIKLSDKIKFDGWQMPLDEWQGRKDNEVPEGTKYLGSFGVIYKGEITGDYFDVYITSNGVIRAFIYSSSGFCWNRHGVHWYKYEDNMSGDRRQEQLEARRRETVIHDGNKRENVIHDGNKDKG